MLYDWQVSTLTCPTTRMFVHNCTRMCVQVCTSMADAHGTYPPTLPAYPHTCALTCPTSRMLVHKGSASRVSCSGGEVEGTHLIVNVGAQIDDWFSEGKDRIIAL